MSNFFIQIFCYDEEKLLRQQIHHKIAVNSKSINNEFFYAPGHALRQ